MRLDASQLATERLHLEFGTQDGSANLLVLGPSVGVGGGYGQEPHAFILDALSAQCLRIAELSWGLSLGRLSWDEGAQFDDLAIDGAISRVQGEPGFVGKITAARMELPGALIEREGLRVRVEGLVIEALEVSTGAEGANVCGGRLSAAHVHLELPTVKARVEGLELAQGFSVQQGDVRVAQLSLSSVAVELPTFGSSSKKNSDRSPESERPPKEPRSSLATLRFLDALHGRFHVDLRVDATIPVLGRRRATHRLRVPVREGALDYHVLEHDLSSLEDAVLDFRVRDDRLCLERDLSMMRLLSKTVVYWPLDEPGEVSLAQQNWIRLRRLLSPRLPESKKEEPKDNDKKGVAVRQLDFDNLDVELSLGAGHVPLPSGGQLVLGSAEQVAIGSLHIGGAVHYEPGEDLDPTELEVTAKGLFFGIDRMPVGGRQLDLSALGIDHIHDVVIHLDGVKPTAISATVRGVHLNELLLTKALAEVS